MKIVFASSEVVPFSKTGGLADVAAGLPQALAAAGHDVWLVTPYYPQLLRADRCPPITATGTTIEVQVGPKRVDGTLLRSDLPGGNVSVLLVDQPTYFDRPQPYGENGTDYKDNCERFVFFSRAVLQAAEVFDLAPDVVHANDWQAGLIPALLEIEYRSRPGFDRTASVFTIHNLAFQGQFWHWDMLLTGLDWKYFNWRQMEFYGNLNLLKTGITFAEMVTTVSPTYAREICTPEFGWGLEGVLAGRGDDLVGILNGIDPRVWNPATDPALPQNYSIDTVIDGKAACKADLQQHCGLAVRGEVPLLGMISRMTDQKGFDLIRDCAEQTLQQDLQLLFLGTGEERYEEFCRELMQRHPGKVSATIGFDETLAHRIEAGADLYLMPSRFEPCGLNQMYSSQYGTIPIVRQIGGLADSVIDAETEHLADGTATGFCFSESSGEALAGQIFRAVEMFQNKPVWTQLIRNGMRRDWSWNRSARDYVSVYQRAVAKRAS